MAGKSGHQVFGAILLLLGVILLLPNLGLTYLGWPNIWPLFIILFGAAFLFGWALSPEHDPGLAFVGTGGLLVGVFLALFAWGILGWGEMAVWWPVFPLIGGLAFLALWAAGGAKDAGILVPAGVGILTGLVALALTRGLIEAETIARWWPVSLILLGVVILLERAFGGRGD